MNLNPKFGEIEGKIPCISDLVTSFALTAVENKISEIESKVSDDDHDKKYITTSEFNKLTTEYFKARLAQVNLTKKTNCDDKLKSLNKKVNSK